MTDPRVIQRKKAQKKVWYSLCWDYRLKHAAASLKQKKTAVVSPALSQQEVMASVTVLSYV